MLELSTWAPALLVSGFLLLLLQAQPASPTARALAAFTCFACTLRYMWWRVMFTFPPHQNIAQQIWALAFLGMEICALTSSCFVYFFMSRHRNRTPDAERTRNSRLQSSPVDVLIPTYNESRDILERTILGAKLIDHPDLRVWVLDDGARPWVEELAAELGALYAFRIRGAHAKAGNINHGLAAALSRGRKPQFVLLLDADFVPSRNILKRILGLFEEPDVGIVQTPQHFFNADPVQSNLLMSTMWPDEQRFFFTCFMPCKDAWGAAFCCGTSAVLRVEALEACGGMATETMTEDMLTTFKMLDHGYRTIYLNERLSMGLAAESLQEFLTQRSRWCMGTLQQLRTRWSFLRRSRVNWINRLSLLDGMLFWFSSSPFRLMLTLSPILFWSTGTSVLIASPPDLLYWMLPMVCGNLIFLHFASGNRVLPIISDLSGLLAAFVITRAVWVGLLSPFGHTFKVTAKGISASGVVVLWSLFWRYAALAVLTTAGILLNVAKFAPGHGADSYWVNLLWSFVNLWILALACSVCIEMPKRRNDQRFRTNEEGLVRLESGEFLSELNDISVSGACLYRQEGWENSADRGVLVLDGGRLEIPFRIVRRSGERIGVSFESNPGLRRALIGKLYSGIYHQDIGRVKPLQVFGQLARSLMS